MYISKENEKAIEKSIKQLNICDNLLERYINQYENNISIEINTLFNDLKNLYNSDEETLSKVQEIVTDNLIKILNNYVNTFLLTKFIHEQKMRKIYNKGIENSDNKKDEIDTDKLIQCIEEDIINYRNDMDQNLINFNSDLLFSASKNNFNNIKIIDEEQFAANISELENMNNELSQETDIEEKCKLFNKINEKIKELLIEYYKYIWKNLIEDYANKAGKTKDDLGNIIYNIDGKEYIIHQNNFDDLKNFLKASIDYENKNTEEKEDIDNTDNTDVIENIEYNSNENSDISETILNLTEEQLKNNELNKELTKFISKWGKELDLTDEQQQDLREMVCSNIFLHNTKYYLTEEQLIAKFTNKIKNKEKINPLEDDSIYTNPTEVIEKDDMNIQEDDSIYTDPTEVIEKDNINSQEDDYTSAFGQILDEKELEESIDKNISSNNLSFDQSSDYDISSDSDLLDELDASIEKPLDEDAIRALDSLTSTDNQYTQLQPTQIINRVRR